MMNYNKLNALSGAPDSSFNTISDEQFEQDLKSSYDNNPPPPRAEQATQETQQNQGFQSAQNPEINQKSKVNLGMIGANTAIGVIDSVIPAVIVWAFALIANKEVKKGEFSLSAKEKETVEPIVQACLEKINIDLSNPFVALSVTLGMIYAGKMFNAKTTDIPEEDNDNPQPKRDGRGRPAGSKNKPK